MTKEQLKTKKIPDTPGAYFFLGKQREILYIGKATSLKNRIASYFAPDLLERRSALIAKMVVEAKTVEWTVTDSVLEALILETNLIRTHKPRYNSIAKDDKSYNHLVITKETIPRILVIRGKDLDSFAKNQPITANFGPFPSGTLLKEALKIVRRLFRFYDTKHSVGSEPNKLTRGIIDFNRQLGLYPANYSKKEYAETIRYIRLFFEGKKQTIIKALTREMMRAAKEERFEDASLYKRRIFALEHIEDVALIKHDIRTYKDEDRIRIEAYDVAHLQGRAMVGVMAVVEAGEVNTAEYRMFSIQSVHHSNDTAALSEMLTRRLGHFEWNFPDIIVVDGSTAQVRTAERVLRKQGTMIPVIGVVKDERHKPKRLIGDPRLIDCHHDDIVLANAEAHRFSLSHHRKKRRKLVPS